MHFSIIWHNFADCIPRSIISYYNFRKKTKKKERKIRERKTNLHLFVSRLFWNFRCTLWMHFSIKSGKPCDGVKKKKKMKKWLTFLFDADSAVRSSSIAACDCSFRMNYEEFHREVERLRGPEEKGVAGRPKPPSVSDWKRRRGPAPTSPRSPVAPISGSVPTQIGLRAKKKYIKQPFTSLSRERWE